MATRRRQRLIRVYTTFLQLWWWWWWGWWWWWWYYYYWWLRWWWLIALMMIMMQCLSIPWFIDQPGVPQHKLKTDIFPNHAQCQTGSLHLKYFPQTFKPKSKFKLKYSPQTFPMSNWESTLWLQEPLSELTTLHHSQNTEKDIYQTIRYIW